MKSTPQTRRPAAAWQRLFHGTTKALAAMMAVLLAVTFTGCEGPESYTPIPADAYAPRPTGTLAAGDVLNISFPGAPELNTTQKIQANGKVSLGTFTPTTGAGQLNMTLDVSGSTQYGEKFALRNTQQDGYAAGKLNEITVSESGVVYARYSNGDDKPLGQVALTTFNNTQGLESKGNNLWVETFESGTPRTGMPDTSNLGKIQAGSLEASTVDLTEQLVNMITAQRNFQANAQMITTQDQITQTVINIR